MAVSLTFGCGFLTCSTALPRDFFKLDASEAVRNRPPVFSARHRSPASSVFFTSKPITWAVKSTPFASRLSAKAQGSESQVSLPSLTRMTVAFSSVYFSFSAACRTASLSGVFPLGWIRFTVRVMRFASTLETGINCSISAQSPLRR